MDGHNRIKRSWGRLKGGFALVLICTFLIGIVVYSPIFTLREVRLTGNEYLSEQDIMKISGIYMGEPLFQLKTDAVTRRLQQDLRIEEASVRRSLPSALVVTVKERKPVATVACEYGYLDLDRRGTVIDGYRTLKEMPIPMIAGVMLHNMYIGDETDDPLVKNILFYLQKLDEESLNQISEVAVISAEYVVAYTTHGVQIRLGKLERLEEKAGLTQDFLQGLKDSHLAIEYVDFNYTAPFVKLAN